MDRRQKDMQRINEVLGGRYGKNRRGAFCVLVDEDGNTTMSGGNLTLILHSVVEGLTYVLVKSARNGINTEEFIDKACRVFEREFRENLEMHILKKYGKPDFSATIPDPEERLRKALLGEE